MYTPAHFAENDPAQLRAFIQRHNFGMLVSVVEGAPFATHLPFLLDHAVGPHGALITHVARANPQWREIGTQQALVIFAGPHAYISPTWYEAGQVVPTWNYTAVHAYGRVECIEDPAELLALLLETVRVHEQGMPRPWSFDPDSTFVQRLLPQIVGLRLVIDRLEGKWKLSQNQPVERREKVARALEAQADEQAQAVAVLMRERLPGPA